MSPTLAEAGRVTVHALDVVLIGYPLPATAVNVEAVTTDCQDNPGSAHVSPPPSPDWACKND